MVAGLPTARRTLAVALVVASLVASGAALWAHGVDGTQSSSVRGTAIDGCTAITEPGRYVLVSNVGDSERDTCIRIRSSDVVLAGRGHVVDGTGAFGTGGVVARPGGGGPLSNVTVRNLRVRQWDDAIRYVDVDGGRVAGTTTAESRVGLTLLNAANVTVVDNTARENVLRGIALFEDSADNTLRNNTARANGYGIALVEPGSSGNRLVGNTATGNEFGVVLVDAHRNVLRANRASGNRIAGVWLTAARNNTLDGNVVSNRFYGVFLSERANGNRIRDTRAVGNAVGIRLRSSDGNVVARNTVRDSSDTAILLISSDDNRVVGNVGGNNARPLSVIRSRGNRVANNSLGD